MTNLSSSPRVTLLHGFLSDLECQHLIKSAGPHLKVSTGKILRQTLPYACRIMDWRHL